MMGTPQTTFSIILSILLVFLFLSRVSAEDDYKPAAWDDERKLGDPNAFAAATPRPAGGRVKRRPAEVGEINCRQWSFVLDGGTDC